MLAGLSPARRRFVLSLVAVVAIAAMATGGLIWHSTRTPAVRPVAQDRPGPILLVPGYGGSLTSLATLAAALRAAGRDVTLVQLPGDATGDLHTQAKALGTAAEAALTRTGAASVDVVGYSAGGVVARLWVADDGGGSLARRVITLGSPHHGTSVAGIAVDLAPTACPTACQQLAPDSALLRTLDRGDETPRGPAWVSFWTTQDQTVVPPDSARLAGATNVAMQAVCPGLQLAHGDLPTSPVVIRAVELELAATPVVALTAADCGRLSS